MSVNPYDLRAGLLKQAQSILDHKYRSSIDLIRFKMSEGIINSVKTVTWPEPPTTIDIIEEAEKLYKFVQTK